MEKKFIQIKGILITEVYQIILMIEKVLFKESIFHQNLNAHAHWRIFVIFQNLMFLFVLKMMKVIRLSQ